MFDTSPHCYIVKLRLNDIYVYRSQDPAADPTRGWAAQFVFVRLVSSRLADDAIHGI